MESRHNVVRWAASRFAIALLLVFSSGCEAPGRGSSDEARARAVARAFPFRESAVTGSPFESGPAATVDGFVAQPQGPSGPKAFFPAEASAPIRLSSAGGHSLGVKEQDLAAAPSLLDGRIIYPGEGTTSFWLQIPNGFEEWLHLAPNPDRHVSLPIASWTVLGATLAQAGEEVHVLDERGDLRWRVSATEGFATGARRIGLRLVAETSEVMRLYVAEADADAVTGELLIDPSWVAGASMLNVRYGFQASLTADGKVLVATGQGGSPDLRASELYDAAFNTFTLSGRTNAPYHALAQATAVSTGKVIVTDWSGWHSEAWNFETGGWNNIAESTPNVDRAPGIRLNDGRLMLLGGQAEPGDIPTNVTSFFDPATESWTNGPVLPSGAKREVSATLLPDGDVLVVGGFNGSASPSAERFDIATGAWTAVPSMSVSRANAGLVRRADGKVMVFGGAGSTVTQLYDPASDTWSPGPALAATANSPKVTVLPSGAILVTGIGGTTTQLYDPVSNSWSLGTAMLVNRTEHHSIILPNGRVLLAGGRNGGTVLGSTELYDYFTPTLTAASPLGGARAAPTATSLASGEVLVTGGSDSGAATATTALYAPSGGTWTTGPPMGVPRSRHRASLLSNGKVLVTGGTSTSGAAVSSCQLYDRLSNSFAAAAAMATPRSGHSATVLPNGKVLVVGGSTPATSAELYDPQFDAWSSAASMPTARTDHTATLLTNDTVLVCGGGSASCERYDIATNSWSSAGSMAASATRSTATLLPNDQVLVTIGGTTTAQLYTVATNTWSAALTMPASHDEATATLLPNGNVAIIGKLPSANLVATLYDYLANRWTSVNGTSQARNAQAAALLPDGRVLLVGGTGASGAIADVDLFDEGRGSLASATPVLTALTGPSASVLTLAGSGFLGTHLGGGGSFLSTQTNFPLLLLRNNENGQTSAAPTYGWTDSSATAKLPAGFKPGSYLATVVVNGVPSASRLFTYTGGATQLDWTTPGRTFTAGACGGVGSVITVRLEDGSGAVATAGAGSISFQASSSSIGGSWYTDAGCSTAAAAGVFTVPSGQSSVDLYYRDTAAGTPAISLTNVSGLSNPPAQSHTVVLGAASKLVVSGVTSPRLTGEVSDVTVEVQDSGGNRVMNYVGTVTFSSSDSEASLPSSYTFVPADNGLHVFVAGVRFASPGSHSLSVTDVAAPTVSGTLTGIIVSACAQGVCCDEAGSDCRRRYLTVGCDCQAGVGRFPALEAMLLLVLVAARRRLTVSMARAR